MTDNHEPTPEDVLKEVHEKMDLYGRAYLAGQAKVGMSEETRRAIEELKDMLEKHLADEMVQGEQTRRALTDMSAQIRELTPAYHLITEGVVFAKWTRAVAVGAIAFFLGVGSLVGSIYAFRKWLWQWIQP